MRQSRDLYLVVLLFLVLIGLTAFATARQAQADQENQVRIPFSSYSVQPTGTRGLQLWLESMGFSTLRIEGPSFELNPAARALFVFSPIEQLTDKQVQSLREWTERGNTLVLCLPAESGPSAVAEFQAQIVQIPPVNREITLDQPILGEPTTPITVQASSGLELSRSDFVTYLSDSGKPLLVSFKQGQGTVWLCSAPSIFTNAALQHDGNAALVGAILSKTPLGSLVAFDEYHLGFITSSDRPSLQSLLYTAPWGWAILYTLVVIFAYMAINGQRFGRVQALAPVQSWRAASEFVRSMAQLYRRGGRRGSALQHYRRHLKRALGRPYRLSPDLPDEEFVSKLRQYRDDVDSGGLLELLQTLDEPSVNERMLIILAQRAISTAALRSISGFEISPSQLPWRYEPVRRS